MVCSSTEAISPKLVDELSRNEMPVHCRSSMHQWDMSGGKSGASDGTRLHDQVRTRALQLVRSFSALGMAVVLHY